VAAVREINRIKPSVHGARRRPCEHAPSVFSVVLRLSSMLIKTATDRTIAWHVPTQPHATPCGLLPMAGALTIYFREARRTTGNAESRMLLAESLTEQVIGPVIEVHRNTGRACLKPSMRGPVIGSPKV
jgi:hypothetical protein